MTNPKIGHNNPPDPLDQAIAPYVDYITEAESWLDGESVQNAEQMKAVDDLAKQIKAAKKAATEADESESKPLYDAWKAAKARYKPTIDDLTRIAKGLAAISNDFKIAEKKRLEEARRREYEEAERKRREAEEAAALANAADLETQRAAAEAQAAAIEAQKKALAANKAAGSVKGLRKVTRYEITDHRALLHWIAKNQKDAITAFIEEWARRNHKEQRSADGLRVWEEKEAY